MGAALADVVGQEVEDDVALAVGELEVGLVAAEQVVELVAVAAPAGGGVGAVGVVDDAQALVENDLVVAGVRAAGELAERSGCRRGRPRR